MPKVLIIDDEPGVLYSLQSGLEDDATTVVTARTARHGIEAVEHDHPDAVILDVRLPDQSGLAAFDRIRKIDPRLPVIIMTAHGSTETAIEAMKHGAFEYFLKPVDLHQLRAVLDRAFELRRMQAIPAVFDQDALHLDPDSDRIIGLSPAMQEVYKAIGRFAPQDVTVLILGESGTGKELVARAIYQHSQRAKMPFLAINCAAIPETLLESELFGHEKGAFTGADRKRIGKFEQANGGTLFLDEIGDMSPATQAKVLRLIQEQQFERVGGNETICVEVRIIAATNADLAANSAAGRFRQDLLYRLNAFTLRLPPLRERADDIPLLANHFLALANRKLGKTVRSIDASAMTLLTRHSWPGNVRELQNALRFAAVQAIGDVVTPASLPVAISQLTPPRVSLSAATVDVRRLVDELLRTGELNIYRQVLQEVDRIVLTAILEHARGNQAQASEILGISRTTLRAKLQSMGLSVERLIQQT